MSVIAIVCEQKSLPAQSLMKLQRTLRRGIADVRECVSQGKPIWAAEIFDEKYDENAVTLRALSACLEENSIPTRVYELPEGETLETCSSVDRCQISHEVLKNILDEADAELGRQTPD